MINHLEKIQLFIKTKQNKINIPSHLSNVILICFVLSLFLVGSCKTSQLSDNANTEKYGLLPEVVSNKYTPAKGYSYTARNYIAHNPDALLHMTEIQIQYLLGNPGIKWQENPAEVWQYRSNDCTLDIYFYNEGLSYDKSIAPKENGLEYHRKVSYYEMRQLGRPEWTSVDKPPVNFLPSKIRTTSKIANCINNIVNKS